MSSHGQTYVAARGEGNADEAGPRLDELLRRLSARDPTFDVDPAALVTALAKLERSLDALDVDTVFDVQLALACAGGDARALSHFDATYMSAGRARLRAMKLADAAIDDVLQSVREKLLVGSPPKLLEYVGRGSLYGLVKVVAVREALSTLRKKRGDDDEELAERAMVELDPETTILKDHYRAHFREAFRDAIRALDSHDRNVLRMYALGGAGLEELAQMYGVHRATIVRTLARVREQLFSETRKALRRRLGIGLSEIDSVLELVQSRLDVSLGRMLESAARSGE
jgi:RNA polymerase sigma-70 factor (ECF subfamily)